MEMNQNRHRIADNFGFSCVYKRSWAGEELVEDHVLSKVISGKVDFYTEDGVKELIPGTIALIRRNSLVKAAKYPGSEGQPCRSINIILGQGQLQKYASDHEISPFERDPESALQLFYGNPFLDAYFGSLKPYEDFPNQLTPELSLLKMNEAITLLLQIKPAIKSTLFYFNEPYKINLEQFMLKNFTFNVPLKEFAKLTGRSLSTFKRDFEAIFSTSPAKWLLRKRLDHAHFLIGQKEESPSEVYHRSGFKNFSHFSTAFKEHYGYSPSSITYSQ